MTRKLNRAFITNLIDGNLKECLSYVKNDNTLNLEIREEYINIYYRGGSILKIEKNSTYNFIFNYGYLKNPCQNNSSSQKDLKKIIELKDWQAYFPKAKHTIYLR